MEMNNDIFTPDLPIPEPVSFEDAPIPTPVEEETPAAAPPPRRRRKADAPVLTIESGDEIETEDAREAAAWHEIHNAYRTRRILSAPLGGIEQTDSGKTIAVVDYNGFRIVIPLKEMMVIVVGAGDTEYDALYDLLACRFIIPIGAAWPLRVLLFLKLTFLEGISWKITRRLFHVDARSVCEKKVIRLARQTSLSCAEIIKCIEMGIRRLKDGYDVLDKLYDDNDLNCDNFAQAVREYHCSREVITAVVNLYLRQQIMIDTY